ncbi:MAG: cupin domain-containing protein [Deltaproteobacteria bacterium]|nr:cupin domain-containing protein [Deltaproteobacteria bacterium]
MGDAGAIIREYGLSPHPEGGWYREFHCSERVLEGLPGYPGPRAAITAIWFCLRRGEFSAFHRLRSEEVWIHLSGGPLELIVLAPGKADRTTIASVEDGGIPAAVVPAGACQAARPAGDYCFVSCLVAPGFDFGDFELASVEELLKAHPGEAETIRSLTRS